MKTKIKKGNVRFRKDGKQLFWLEIPFEVVRDKRLTETAKWVLAYIRFAQHDNPKAWPAIQTIAKIVGKSIPQVKKALRLLKETGWLNRSYRTGPKGCSTSTVPVSSDWKKNGVYEVEDTFSFALNKEDTMSSGSIVDDTIPRQDSIVEDTQYSIVHDTNMVSPTIHRKEKEKITKKTTTTKEVEEDLIKEELEENPSKPMDSLTDTLTFLCQAHHGVNPMKPDTALSSLRTVYTPLETSFLIPYEDGSHCNLQTSVVTAP